MRALLIIAALVFGVAGCTTNQTLNEPVKSLAAHSGQRVTGFATLAEFGTWEMSLAPAYTRLAGLRYNAARRLDDGRISVDIARQVLTLSDDVRSLLDQSRRGNRVNPTPMQRQRLHDAGVKMDAIDALLGGNQ